VRNDSRETRTTHGTRETTGTAVTGETVVIDKMEDIKIGLNESGITLRQ